MHGLFLALPAILLSPKRCLCVNYARFAHIMRRPLWTGRQPLNAVGRGLFPFTPVFVFLLYVHPRQADDGYSKSVGRVRAKRELTHRHRLCKKNERVANRLRGWTFILFPCTSCVWFILFPFTTCFCLVVYN